ncbi:hypothetical protein ABH19_02605 [Leptospirillum sp. Group II 'CF-1']|nr:hypothetical protein ABH19_02605 [Leptospirillum sp. Group II 'CF-1']
MEVLGIGIVLFSKDEAEQTILNSIHPEQSFFPDKDGDPGDYFRKYRETILKIFPTMIWIRRQDKKGFGSQDCSTQMLNNYLVP